MIEYETIKQKAAEFMLNRGWKKLTAKRRKFKQSLFEHTMVELDTLISLPSFGSAQSLQSNLHNILWLP